MTYFGYLGLVLLPLLVACGQSNDNASALDESRPYATVAVDASDGVCDFRWNGRQVSIDQLQQEAMSMLEALIEDRGGVESMTESDLPSVTIETLSMSPFGCSALALAMVQSAGFYEAKLHTTNDDREVRALVSISPMLEEIAVTRIWLSTSEPIRWEDEPIDIATLRQRAAAVPASDYDRIALVLTADEDVLVRDVQDALAAVSDGGILAELAACSTSDLDSTTDSRRMTLPLPSCEGK